MYKRKRINERLIYISAKLSSSVDMGMCRCVFSTIKNMWKKMFFTSVTISKERKRLSSNERELLIKKNAIEKSLCEKLKHSLINMHINLNYRLAIHGLHLLLHL